MINIEQPQSTAHDCASLIQEAVIFLRETKHLDKVGYGDIYKAEKRQQREIDF